MFRSTEWRRFASIVDKTYSPGYQATTEGKVRDLEMGNFDESFKLGFILLPTSGYDL